MRVLQTISKSLMNRHVHKRAYAAIVLSGHYEEAGDSGRHLVQTGNVLFHEAFEAHLDRIPDCGAVVLNVPLPAEFGRPSGLGRVADPDTLVRLVERRDLASAALLLLSAAMQKSTFQDWPDELAAALAQNASVSLSGWSEHRGISAWDLSRGFAKAFGISPSAFRARARARQAWRAIRANTMSLSATAAHFGFSDQAHMTRSVKAVTGRCPTAWCPSRK